MSDSRFEITILEQYCKGCGLCVQFCPKGKLSIDQKPNRRGVQAVRVDPAVDCTGCLQCTTICPDAAIEVRRVGAPVRSSGTCRDASGRK